MYTQLRFNVLADFVNCAHPSSVLGTNRNWFAADSDVREKLKLKTSRCSMLERRQARTVQLSFELPVTRV